MKDFAWTLAENFNRHKCRPHVRMQSVILDTDKYERLGPDERLELFESDSYWKPVKIEHERDTSYLSGVNVHQVSHTSIPSSQEEYHSR